MSSQFDDKSFDADLSTPADRVPANAPVVTRVQVLPFGELTWENFERLCYRLAGKSTRVEYVARYGRSGQAQQGIDLFARFTNGKYEVWQAKRYRAITPGDVKKIVDEFRAGTWKDKTESFILAVQASLADTKLQDEIEAQTNAFKVEGISFIARGGEELSELLRGQPEIVDDFFGRWWVEAFLGQEAAKALGARLDGAEFARVRSQLRAYYDAHFHLLDVGIALPLVPDSQPGGPPSLLRRYAQPDVLVRDTIADEQRPSRRDELREPSASPDEVAGDSGAAPVTRIRRRAYVRRVLLSNWLADGMQLAVIGEAGGGKSTFLRCVALDLLTEQALFPQIARRWGELLPVHIPFSRWSRSSAALGRAPGLKEVVAETLQLALTTDLVSLLNRAIDERRVLLLIDGLDEWSDEQAARTTLQHILAFVATHGIPTIATARPRGLDKIGTIPPGWRRAELAPLSLDQQRRLAEVWFARTLPKETTLGGASDNRGPIKAHLNRFFTELERDRRLSALAGNPLLLIGLIALSIRQISLPRNRTQAIRSLVAILLETHPEQRATAAGDTRARFVHIPDAEDRRAVLARLAFVARSASGGGSYDTKEARQAIRDYLADPATFAYSAKRAQDAAAELLAVNAETIGLLAERAPGEIGFAHAVFEEYLAAEHIQSWPFDDMIEFVRARAGEPLWRNVISNLCSLLARPTEVDSVVAAIASARMEDANRESAIVRDVLLADLAFSSCRTPPATAQRLVARAFEVIERGDWILARREVLKAALANVDQDVSAAPVDDRLVSWAPCREKYLSHLFDAFAGWKPSPEVCRVLLGGIHDEERLNQRSAARALARLYAGDAGVQQTLRDMLRSTLDLSVATAALEALTLGWPETPGLWQLHDAAFASSVPALRLAGVSGRAASGRTDQRDRDTLVKLLSEFPEIDFWDRPDARMLLTQHWPDDPTLIEVSLEAVNRIGPRRADFERESAMHYLIRCSPANPKVTNWVRQELTEQYPFILAHDVWDCIAPFAIQHDDIRASVIARLRSEYGRHNLHSLGDLIVKLGGEELRDQLIEIARAAEHFDVYWAVKPLLQGWGRSDPIVASFMEDEIASWDDKRIKNIAAILPQILTDPDACRARLLSIARGSEPLRLDLIAHGLASLGCTAQDAEAVEALLAGVGKGAPLFDPGIAVLTNFSANPRVREYALQALSGRAPPLAALAAVYEDDPAIRSELLTYANPLPTTLRADITEAAFASVNSHSGFERLLKGYDIEVDGELKIAGSIYYHRHLAQTPVGSTDTHFNELVDALRAVGPDLDERRAAAFAGILLLNRVAEIPPMTEHGDKPLHVHTGGRYGHESDSLMALICERWEDVREVFGASLPSRFGSFGADEGHLWDCLAPHINASPAARRDFLAFCNQTETNLGLQSFLALAREQPASELLLNHCWRVFGRDISGQHKRHSAWAVQRVHLEIAYILRDHFCGRADVKDRLRKLLQQGRRSTIVACVLVEPDNPLLDQLRYGPREIAAQFSDWVTAVHIASAHSGTEEFLDLLFRMINRDRHGIWDFQEVTNRPVLERLQHDAEAILRIKERLASGPTESEIASLPRYLVVAGAMDADVFARCQSLLQDESRHELPRAGYDAIENVRRAVSRSLLEVLVPALSL